MVHIMIGQEGSGKTKKLLEAINEALSTESGSIVCIEKGHTMRYDLDHRVRLVDSSEYMLSGYTALKGFLSGLHAGNFDITHIFVDNLYKVVKTTDDAETEAFLDWCEKFSESSMIRFTFTVSGEEETAPAFLKKYC